MAKKKKSTVCDKKGHLRFSKWADCFLPSPCECRKPFRRYRLRAVVQTSFVMGKTQDVDCPIRIRLIGEKEKGPRKGEHFVVPCEDKFQKRFSKGTRIYHRWTGTETFPGCQVVDDELLKDGKISYQGLDLLRENDMPRWPEELEGAEGVVLDMDRLSAEVAHWDFMRNRPRRHKKKPDNPFSRYANAPVFKRFWKKLKKEHRKAVRLYYLKNEDDVGMRPIAKKLGISLSTLHDWLEKARKLLTEELAVVSPPVRLRKGKN